MNKRTRKEMKHDQDQHYGGLIVHCDSDTAKESFSRPVYGSRQELEDVEQEKYLAEWNNRLKERKKRKDERKLESLMELHRKESEKYAQS